MSSSSKTTPNKEFSVLMSVYHRESAEYLDAAIQSVIHQTLQPSQVVIVKDGPLAEDLEKTLAKYSTDPLFTFVSLPINRGLGIALNAGLARCRYDIVARMDSDDISTRDRFKKQIHYMHKHPNTILIGANIVEFDESMSKRLSVRSTPQSKHDIILHAKKQNPFNHMTVVFRKEAVERAGGYLDCPYFEDYYLWARMLQSDGDFHNIQEELVHARGGDSMIDRRGGWRYVKSIINFQHKMLQIKFISRQEYIFNCTVRTLVALMPRSLRGFLYKKKLRTPA